MNGDYCFRHFGTRADNCADVYWARDFQPPGKRTDDIEMTTRLRNVLREQGITTVAQLRMESMRSPQGRRPYWPNCGDVTFDEIDDILRLYQ